MNVLTKILILTTLALPGCLYAADSSDSSSFVNVTTHNMAPLCSLSGIPKPITFNSATTKAKCSDKYTDGNYIVVGISSEDGNTKTMYCQKLVCAYSVNQTPVTFYNLPASS